MKICFFFKLLIKFARIYIKLLVEQYNKYILNKTVCTQSITFKIRQIYTFFNNKSENKFKNK